MSWNGNGNHDLALGECHSLVREKDGVICRLLIYNFTKIVIEDDRGFSLIVGRRGRVSYSPQ